MQVNHSGDGFRGQTVDEPLDTITAKHGTGVVMPVMMRNNEHATGSDVQQPISTITTGGHHMLIAPSMVQMGYGEREGQKPRVLDIQGPLGTVVAQGNKFGMVSAFISKYYGGGNSNPASGMEQPLSTVTTIDHNAVCAAYITQFNNHSIGQGPEAPLNTITAGQGHFGDVRAFLVKYYSGENNTSGCDTPAPTITTKDRMGLVTVHGQDYMIVDIGLRMLTPRELFDAQGFPPDYIIDVDPDGKTYPKDQQVARCGNAVPPPFATALVRANLPELCRKETA